MPPIVVEMMRPRRYVLLLSVRNLEVRRFYEGEALRGGWTVRQLDRQQRQRAFSRHSRAKRLGTCFG